MGRRRRGEWDEREVAREETREREEPLGKRIGRFVTMMGMVLSVSGVVVVTQRLSDDALALLLGLSCGVAAMLPTVVLGGLWMKRELGQRGAERQVVGQAQAMGQPQVIVVTPQALPGYGHGYGQAAPVIPAQWQPVAAARDFKIVGGAD